MSWPQPYRIPLQAVANDWWITCFRRTEIFDQPLRLYTRSLGEVLGVPMRFIRARSPMAGPMSVPMVRAPASRRFRGSWSPRSSLPVPGSRPVFALPLHPRHLRLLRAFGLWNEAMLTMASVSVTIVLGVVLGCWRGLPFGGGRALKRCSTPSSTSCRRSRPSATSCPCSFSSGFGPVAALVATMIFALRRWPRPPPTPCAGCRPRWIRTVDMTGASFWQQQWKILISTARTDIFSASTSS